MELRQLRYFCTVAERRSFTAAAEALNVSQPTLGVQIKNLEEEHLISVAGKTIVVYGAR